MRAQIKGRPGDEIWVVLEIADSRITSAAKDSSDLSRSMIVVDMRPFLSPLCRSANRADAALSAEDSFEFSQGDASVMPQPGILRPFRIDLILGPLFRQYFVPVRFAIGPATSSFSFYLCRRHRSLLAISAAAYPRPRRFAALRTLFNRPHCSSVRKSDGIFYSVLQSLRTEQVVYLPR